MSRFELIRQTFLGNIEERVPISLWRHHPHKDRTPEGLADAEIAFHKKWDHDIMKVSFHGRYPVVDWGCVAVYDGAISGSTTCTSCAIHDAQDWETLEEVDVNDGEFGRQVRAIELIHDYAHGVVPVLATIFDPPMVASKLCEGEFKTYIDSHPDVMSSALEMITRVMVDFAKATLEAGADGVFLASQHSTHSAVTDEQYQEFVFPYDQKLISQLRGRSRFIVMHLHAKEEGERIRFREISRTPGLDAINWEDQSAWPSLSEGKKISRKTVFGGIDHNKTLRTGTPDEVEMQVREAIRAAGFEHLVVAPGCVITVDTPEENIKAVVDTVKSIDPMQELETRNTRNSDSKE